MSSPSESGTPSKLTEKTSFIYNTLIVMGGTAIGALITIVASPVLTRYYTPDAFGIFAVFSSIVSLISIVVCMRYEVAIVLPKSDGEAINLLALCILIATLFSLLMIPVLWLLEPQISSLFNLPDLGFYIFIIPLMVFINGIFIAFYYWNTRGRKFKQLAGARVTSSVVTNGYQLGSAFLGFISAGGLIIGSYLGSFVSTVILSSQTLRTDKVKLKSSIRWSSMVSGLKRYRNFPIYDSSAVLLNSLSWQLPVFLLAAFFSPAVVGFYSLGFRVLYFPMSLIGNSLAQNFIQKAAESKDKIGQIVERIFEVLVIVGIYPICLLTLVGADVFMVIFGPAWGEAGIYLQILSIWSLVWFVSAPLDAVFAVLEKQAYFLRLNIAILGTRFGSLVIGGFLGDPRLALVLFSGTGILVYGYMNYLIMQLSGVSFQYVKRILIHNSILFVPAGAVILFLKFIMNYSSLAITLASLLILIAYYVYLLKTNETIKGIFYHITDGRIRI